MINRLVVVVLYVVGLAVLVSSKSHVRHLTATDFEEQTNDGTVHFVKFYAPWCGHCKRLMPTWEDLAKEFAEDTELSISSVDCTKHRAVCDKAGVKGFPTLKIYYGGSSGEMYKGDRSLDSLKSFANQQKLLNLAETMA